MPTAKVANRHFSGDSIDSVERISILDRATLLLLGLALIIFAVWAGDRVGWEGDDLSVMFGIAHLEALGRENVYRYAWQPWTYEILHALRLTGFRFLDVTYIANVAGMLGVTLFISLLRTSIGKCVPHPLLLSVLLALAVPELWLTTLYFNSTALALPFFIVALTFAQHAHANPNVLSAAIASGWFFGVSCLLRMDFALAGPFLLVMISTGSLRRHLAWLVAAMSMPFLLIITQAEWLSQLFKIGNNYETGQLPWGAFNSVKVVLLTIGPALFVIPILLLRSVRWREVLQEIPLQRVAQLGCLLPMMLPLKNLYSGKYLVPFVCCAIWLMAQHIGRLGRSKMLPYRWRGRLIIATMVLSLSFLTTLIPPHLAWFVTHDGLRSFGGYRHLISKIRSTSDRQSFINAPVELAHLIENCPSISTVILPKLPDKFLNDAWNFGWTPLHLLSRGWRLTHYESVSEAKLLSPNGNRIVRIVSAQRFESSSDAGELLLDLRVLSPQRKIQMSANASCG